ncbi:MAG TPA: DUF72 domain-containing protein [Myxococcales bacterium]|jgi:uncharacterized protein YecE (DUF72 family)
MRIAVGTSGFSYVPWRGRFYPADLPAEEMLGFYARQFDTVELNNTFYRLPSRARLSAWASEVQPGFTFAMKAPQRITHVARLSGAAEILSIFLNNASELGGMLGPILFLLPPSLKPDTALLSDFLDLLPQGLRAAFGFRHRGWLLDDHVPDLLRRHGKAVCFEETDESSTPWISTTTYGYLRLRRLTYSQGDLAALAKAIREQPWRETFAYFKHEEQARGPAYATQLKQHLSGEPLRAE